MEKSLIGCLNNYSKSELYELFGTNEDELKNCMKCPNSTTVDNGIITCKYFNKGDKDES